MDIKCKSDAFNTMRESARNVIEQAYVRGDSRKKERIRCFINDPRIETIMKEWHYRDKSAKKESLTLRMWNEALYRKNYQFIFLMLNIYGVLHHNRWK